MFKKVIRWVLIALCIILIGYEAYSLYADNKEYDKARDEYADIKSSSITSPAIEDTPEIVEYPLLSIDYDYLKQVNPDFAGWLFVPALDISYPVVKENTVDEYLRVTFDGTPNKAGCLFTDVLSSDDFTGWHDMIFGHNMRDESMFGKLKYLKTREYQEKLRENPYIYIYTPEYVYQYEAFGYYVTTVGSDAYSEVTNEEEYDEFLEYIRKNSYYSFPEDVDFSTYNSLLTLSTCSGSSGSGKRFVLHTVKRKAWNNL